MTIYKQWEITSVLLHKATNFKLTISSSETDHFILELFKWDKICKLVQIGGIVIFFQISFIM